MKILKFIFYVSILILAIVSLYPGSLFGYIFYGDIRQEADLVDNPFGSSINHFIYYLYVSLLGFYIYWNTENIKKITYGLFFLSINLEVAQLLIPIRSFEIIDLVANILGVIFAYSVVKIYLLFIKL